MVAQRHQCYNHHCLVTVEFLIQSLSHHLLSWIEKTTEWLPGDSGLNSSCMDSLRCLILQILEVICSATSTFMLTANSCSSQQSPPPHPKTQKSQQNCNMVWLKVYPMQQDIKATLSTKKRKSLLESFCHVKKGFDCWNCAYLSYSPPRCSISVPFPTKSITCEDYTALFPKNSAGGGSEII